MKLGEEKLIRKVVTEFEGAMPEFVAYVVSNAEKIAEDEEVFLTIHISGRGIADCMVAS